MSTTTQELIPVAERTLTLIDIADTLAKDGQGINDIHAELCRVNTERCESAIDEDELYQMAIDAHSLVALSKPQQEEQAAPSIRTQALGCSDAKELYTYAPALAALKRSSPMEFGILKTELKEKFGRSLNMRDLLSTVMHECRKQEQEERGEKQDVADVAMTWASRHRDEWGYDETIQAWRMWNGTYWQEEKDKASFLDQEAVAALQEAGIAVNTSNGMNTFQRIAASHCKRDFRQVPGKVHFENGSLDLNTMEFNSWHDRGDLFTYCLPYCFNRHGSHPNIDAFLRATIPDAHARQAYIAHVGLSLIGDTYMESFFLALGASRSGKTTLLRIANATNGNQEREFAGPSLFSRELEGKRSRATWGKKRVVCVDELPAEALREEEILKTMTAHGGAERRGMNKDENEDNQWLPKLLMTTNDTPRYKDNAGAIKERAVIAMCPNYRPREQRDVMLFQKRLLPEIGAFASTCIQYALAARNRGYYPMSGAMKQLLDRIAAEGNPLKAFIADECVLDPGARYPSGLLHTAYAVFCAENGHKYPLATNSMVAALRDMGKGIKAIGSAWWGDPEHERKKQRCLQGIRVKTEAEREQDMPGDDAVSAEYQDDDLLFQAVEMSTVSTIGQRSKSETVDVITPLAEPEEGHMSTMSTVNSQKLSRESVVSSQPGPVHNTSSLQNIVVGKTPLTSLTSPIEQPAEPSQYVNGRQNSTVDTVDIQERKALLLSLGAPDYPPLEYRSGTRLGAGRASWEKALRPIGRDRGGQARLADMIVCAQKYREAVAS